MSQPSLEDLAIKAKDLAIKAKDLAIKADLYPSDVEIKKDLNRTLSGKRKALTALIQGIEKQLPSLCQHGFNADIDMQAHQELFFYICKNIDNYQKNQPVMHWVRTVLPFKKIDAYNFNTQRKQGNQTAQVYSTDVTSIDKKTGQTLLDRHQLTEVNPSNFQELVTIIKEDPEGLFRNKLFKKNPKANFQAIALMRLDEIKWEEIVEKLEIGNTTGPVSTFYQRCYKEFKATIEEYLKGGK
ncbi:MAG TPA: hypothetical protein DCQ51_06890 [Planktothrix sp. UBA8407]|nr:hypothetical protein [Planktothrix sp. UBA8407]HBK22009.1 hypothetical protein [Planktothrix sp. UBA10369]